MLDRKYLLEEWGKAAISGSLLTPKHDPNTTDSYAAYRTVLSMPMSASLESFITSGNYTIDCFRDANFPGGAGYFQIKPKDSSYSVVGSSIVPGSIGPVGTLDSLVIVSGSYQGWHIYAESSTNVLSLVSSGRLTAQGHL